MPLRRPLVGEELGQAGDAVLGGGVARDADAALEGEQRGDVDDGAAGLAREGGAGEGLGEEEHRLEVHVDHVVPVGLGEVDGVGAADDAGVVDEDVERPGPAERLPAATAGSSSASVNARARQALGRDQRRASRRATSARPRPPRAPARASPSAIAWPMPVLAPVTSATLPSRRKGSVTAGRPSPPSRRPCSRRCRRPSPR